EPKRTMRGQADVVVERRVGAELGAVLRARPRFCRRDQRAADTTSPRRRHDVPAFEISDIARAAAVDDVANRELCESDRRAAVDGDEHFRRLATVAAKEPLDFAAMSVGVVRPERPSHLEPRIGVGTRHRPYAPHRTTTRPASARTTATPRSQPAM